MTIRIGTITLGDLRVGPQGPPGPPGTAVPHNDLDGRDVSGAHPASVVTYDPTASGLVATDAQAAIDEVAGELASKVDGSDPRLTDARYPTSHASSHASGGDDAISPSDIGAVPTSRTITAGAGLSGGGDLSADRTLSVSFGAAAGTACEGNDARLSNARTPTAHAASHATGGTDAISPASIGAVPTSRTVTAGTGLTGGGDLSANRTIAVSFGSTAGTVCQGNDSRLSDARTPTAHASSHLPGGTDAIPPVAPVEIDDTTYTLTAADHGRTLLYTHASGCTVTVPDDLPAGHTVEHRARGGAAVAFVAGGSTAFAVSPGCTAEIIAGGVAFTSVEPCAVCAVVGELEESP